MDRWIVYSQSSRALVGPLGLGRCCGRDRYLLQNNMLKVAIPSVRSGRVSLLTNTYRRIIYQPASKVQLVNEQVRANFNITSRSQRCLCWQNSINNEKQSRDLCDDRQRSFETRFCGGELDMLQRRAARYIGRRTKGKERCEAKQSRPLTKTSLPTWLDNTGLHTPLIDRGSVQSYKGCRYPNT
jgi:hypothetical protein